MVIHFCLNHFASVTELRYPWYHKLPSNQPCYTASHDLLQVLGQSRFTMFPLPGQRTALTRPLYHQLWELSWINAPLKPYCFQYYYFSTGYHLLSDCGLKGLAKPETIYEPNWSQVPGDLSRPCFFLTCFFLTCFLFQNLLYCTCPTPSSHDSSPHSHHKTPIWVIKPQMLSLY